MQKILEHITQKLSSFQSLPPKMLAMREDFWSEIQALYTLSPDFINLENGYYGVLPTPLLEAYKGHIDALNLVSSLYMRREQPQDMERLKERLAPIIGSTAQEIAFARNATEALNVIINGIDLQAGEEILLSAYGYPSALDAAAQRKARYGTPYRVIKDAFQHKNTAEIVQIFESHLQPQTRLLVLTHLIHYTGQILPVREITAMAHTHGVEVLVDSAHAFAQLPFQVSDIGCDYWAANLHKWLYAPLTGGILAIKQDKIHRIWGLLGDNTYPKADIRKLERFSALNMPTFLTVFDSIDFYDALGVQNKQARLQYLKNYWLEQVKDLPHVIVYTPEASCAIASIAVKGLTGQALAQILWEQYQIFSAAIQIEDIDAIRLVVQLHTKISDLERLVQAIREIARYLPA